MNNLTLKNKKVLILSIALSILILAALIVFIRNQAVISVTQITDEAATLASNEVISPKAN